jgi:hypothetical protein
VENARQLDRGGREAPKLGTLGKMLGELLESRTRELESRIEALEAARREAGAAS